MVFGQAWWSGWRLLRFRLVIWRGVRWRRSACRATSRARKRIVHWLIIQSLTLIISSDHFIYPIRSRLQGRNWHASTIRCSTCQQRWTFLEKAWLHTHRRWAWLSMVSPWRVRRLLLAVWKKPLCKADWGLRVSRLWRFRSIRRHHFGYWFWNRDQVLWLAFTNWWRPINCLS